MAGGGVLVADPRPAGAPRGRRRQGHLQRPAELHGSELRQGGGGGAGGAGEPAEALYHAGAGAGDWVGVEVYYQVAI